jgi:hypothetical protein
VNQPTRQPLNADANAVIERYSSELAKETRARILAESVVQQQQQMISALEAEVNDLRGQLAPAPSATVEELPDPAPAADTNPNQ